VAMEEDNLIKFPHTNTPLWTYMEKYYKTLRTDGMDDADEYLAARVPGPLQGRVKATVLRMIRGNNNNAKRTNQD